MGDGATDIGVFHESLNLAALWDLPVVFVVENNGYADFIAQRDHQRIEQVSGRAAGYGMAGETVDGNDVEEVQRAAARRRGPRAGRRRAHPARMRDLPLARPFRGRPAAVPDARTRWRPGKSGTRCC